MLEERSKKKQRRKSHGSRNLAACREMGNQHLWDGRIGRPATYRSLDQGSKRIGKQPIGLVALRSRNLGRNTGGISFPKQSRHQLRADHESALEPDLS